MSLYTEGLGEADGKRKKKHKSKKRKDPQRVQSHDAQVALTSQMGNSLELDIPSFRAIAPVSSNPHATRPD